MKVFTSAPVGTTIKFKLEGVGNAERDVQTTVSNAWEELKWDFTGESANFNTLVFMFDFGNVGDGTANSTFLFDGIQQIFGGSQLDLHVTFEDNSVNYTTTDFGNNVLASDSRTLLDYDSQTRGFGIGGLFGLECFIFPKLSLGAELGYNYI